MRAIERLQAIGLRRAGTPRTGFRWVRPDGRPAAAADAERARRLALPPAWTDVRVSPVAGAKLQAIGRDRAGRWQYRYHPDFVRRRAGAKYRRLLRFAAALPRIRARVTRDLRRRGVGRERVLAAMVRILATCPMRPGSEAYAREHGSYGLTTVQPRHVRVEGDRVVFDFRGKSGRRQVRELEDAPVARLVRTLLRVPGRDVFKFEEGGEVVDVRRRHLNAYLREAAGAPFTAKDFRTWAGTVLCASELAAREREIVPGRTSRRQLEVAAVKAVAARLGNTPAVARASYVSPAVLHAFGEGRVIGCCYAPDELGVPVTRGLHPVEAALVRLLREEAPAPGTAAARGGGAPLTRAARRPGFAPRDRLRAAARAP
ncbi:DNA topoisomerase IB [Anaeromyxobacter dehalogenans]|uniref:Type I topoisomerase n=1 Tax=Anaeromyxobacter dehalogenans (strain 2CP-C) TaxID=290397 RepID=Q2IDR2_ANADE|nr:DNA topoisomerase IB [Anaeromyxobacter dehalogenans]ABC82721.1 type I topoisomerase [Anaeromyxobacter dehalogenans 2CP-C]